jgi:hypothetical protein
MVPSARSPERPGRGRVWRVAPDRLRERPPPLPPLSRCEASSPLCEHLPRRSEGVIRTSPEPHELPREMVTALGFLPLTAQWRSESFTGLLGAVADGSLAPWQLGRIYFPKPCFETVKVTSPVRPLYIQVNRLRAPRRPCGISSSFPGWAAVRLSLNVKLGSKESRPFTVKSTFGALALCLIPYTERPHFRQWEYV